MCTRGPALMDELTFSSPYTTDAACRWSDVLPYYREVAAVFDGKVVGLPEAVMLPVSAGSLALPDLGKPRLLTDDPLRHACAVCLSYSLPPPSTSSYALAPSHSCPSPRADPSLHRSTFITGGIWWRSTTSASPARERQQREEGRHGRGWGLGYRSDVPGWDMASGHSMQKPGA